MDAQVDPKLLRSINSTKKLLGKHISKPVLADKYLGRPPFRFLLEIVNNVIQQTSFMKDTFSPKELKYNEISSAEDKRAVLKKVIEAIENETGEKCGARTSKILSGKEPEKTNEMLQLLAKAISSHSNKPKKKSEDPKPLEKPTTLPAEDANKMINKEEPISNDHENNKKETTKKEDNVPKKKTEPPKNRSSPISKKPSSTTTSSNVKARPSGDKISLSSVKSKPSMVKSSVSSTSSSKVPSKETLKSNVGSPSASSSTLVAPRKVSSSNISKSQSRQSLTLKPSASPIKVNVLPEQTKIPGKQHQENVEKSKSTDKLQQKSEEKPVPKAVAAMPPETTAEVPLQRPVTRTKYRQKTNEGENEVSEVGKEAPVEATPQKPDKPPPSPAKSANNDEHQLLLENDKKECGSSGVRSGRSTSSDEVVTEHMNEKISEWRSRSTPAEAVKQVEPEEPVSAQTFMNKTGWINEETESSLEVPRAQTPMNRVFDSVENFTVQDEKNKAASVVVPPTAQPVTKIVREDAIKKVFKRPITVLRDNESEDDDDDTFLVQEKIESDRDMALDRLQQDALLMNATGPSSVSLDMAYLPPEQRTFLVNQIIETQKELEKLSSGNYHQRHHQGHLLESELAERDKAAVREVYMKQVEDLKGAIQKMSKCANPLANIIQRSQDDACLMEIEYRKYRQENDRLQKQIDEAKGDTTRSLHPLTEELAQLDNRIEKVEGAIVLAKQRLSLIDSEYSEDFIAQIANTPTEDETQARSLEADPILQFRGNFPGQDDDDEDENGGIKNKSLMDVFKRAVSMHEGTLCSDNDNFQRALALRKPVVKGSPKIFATPTATTTPKSERRLLNRTVFGEDSPLGRRTNRILAQLEQEQTPVNKENKPTWWD